MNMKRKIHSRILSWENIIEKPNRFGTPSFFINDNEFAHFHSESQLDVRIPKSISQVIKLDKRIEPNPYSDKWFLINFKNENDAKFALNIIRKTYEELK